MRSYRLQPFRLQKNLATVYTPLFSRFRYSNVVQMKFTLVLKKKSFVDNFGHFGTSIEEEKKRGPKIQEIEGCEA